MANKPTKPTAGPSMGQYTFGWDGTDYQALNLDASGNLAALPIPTGAATSANQTDGTQVAKVHGSVAEGAAIPAPVVAGGKDAAGNSLALDNTADGLSVRQSDATKLLTTEASASAIKDAAELVSVTSRLAGSLSNLVRGIHVLGHDGTNFRTLLTNVAGNLIPKSPVAADFLVTEASAATILSRLTTGGQAIVAIQDITTALNRMQAVYEIPITWAGVGTAQVDCGALLDAATKYALVCTTWDSVTGDGATKVRLSVGRVTGFTAGADRDQLYRSDEMTYAANVAGQTDPVNGIRPFLSDATGHVWLYIETTGGTSTGEGSIFVKKTL